MKKLAIYLLTALTSVTAAYAGNPDRAGSSGAGHLLINPWARSSGVAGSSMASINGIEASFLNVAGLAFVRKTELVFTNTQYLVGTGIKLNAFGFGQKVGESGALGLTVTNMNFGDLDITTEDLPEGGIGTFSPNYTNIGLSYAKGFSNSIYGGLTVRLISESIYNAKAQGFSFDAGIRYVTGENDHVRFGIALRNVGPPMRYSGDGLNVSANVTSNGQNLTVSQRSEKYELPSLVNVGFAYDFIFNERMKLTADGAFVSNSFTNDQFALGGTFAFNEKFFLRGGYLIEKKAASGDAKTTAYTGPTAGATVQIPVGANGTEIGLDYSYRVTNPFSGVHSIGIHIAL
ncbi:MAG: PorV/PorQ family protein [Flavobacteriales bacterium]